MSKTFLFQAIQFSQTVLIQTIQFSISMQLVLFNPLIRPYLGQSGPGSNGNEGVLHIPQSSSITGTSPSDCLVLYPGHSLGVVLPLWRGIVNVFYSPSWLGNVAIFTSNVLNNNWRSPLCTMSNQIQHFDCKL